MRYAECLGYLNRLGHEIPVAKSGLDNIRTLLHALGDPHRRYPSVLIAGTNGKGSVAAFLSSILSASGLATGLYTSPHLVGPEERISLDGQQVSQERFAAYVSRTVEAIRKIGLASHPTFFETVTAAAFLCFAESKVDIAVVEVGMGGRSDSTNVLDPILSVITSVSIDHQVFLGESLDEIARHKAGIIHEHGMAVSACQPPEVRRVLDEEAAIRAATLRFADDTQAIISGSEPGLCRFVFEGIEFQTGLYGRHQVGNAVLALTAAGVLRERGFPIGPTAMQTGVRQARIRGRIQKIGDQPAVFVDGAHNDEALVKLAEFVTEYTDKPRALVFGLMSDKRLSSSPSVLAGCFDRVYLTRPSSGRAAGEAELRKLFSEGIWVSDPREALKQARRNAKTVVVSGSLYLAGEILQHFTEPHR